MNERKPARPGRQIFVLTPEERRTIAFVLCALVLGVATKHYRDAHPRPPKPLPAKEQRTAKKVPNFRHAPASNPSVGPER
ncbi:MAG TPA: hypothetical protein VFQ78_02655 [Candidatus Udaeobacter sp.]|jgi:hypothetical protein|nr:hypothetical protein [Candidatus Udaeobacter sp.]